LDDTQELFYPAIVRAIRETGYDGFLGQEFVPRGDPIASLRAAVALCDV
jgi:hydroxypyruvate isomerase